MTVAVYMTKTGVLCFDGSAEKWAADLLKASHPTAQQVLTVDTEEDAVLLFKMCRAKRSVNSKRLYIPFALSVPASGRLKACSGYLRRCYRRVQVAKNLKGVLKTECPPKTVNEKGMT